MARPGREATTYGAPEADALTTRLSGPVLFFSENIQKKVGGPDRSVSNNKFSDPE